MKILILLLLNINLLFGLTLDEKLKIIINSYSLNSKKEVALPKNKVEVELGKLFFEETILSGNRDIACVNCHLDKFNSTDGLPLAVGVKGEGEGQDRYYHGEGILVQRNALSLFGRADKDFKSFFWDGKVEISDNTTFSKFGNRLSTKFKNPLAVAAILPIMERDELIDDNNNFSKTIGEKIYIEKYIALTNLLRDRIYAEEEYRKLLGKLEIGKENFELADIGNAISSFIEHKFPLKTTAYDEYLDGNLNSLSKNQKEGMLLFYGKGRCAFCHKGKFFSNFEYSSIGMPQGFFAPHSRHRDLGRAGVTNKLEDIYKFRVPPLLNISKTQPYGHNGAFNTLKEIVIHHFNPIDFYKKNESYYDADFYKIGKLIQSRDEVLSTIDIKSDEEINMIIDFLGTL